MEMGHGTNALAQTIVGIVKEVVNRQPPAFDFGTIQEDMSLLQDTFPIPIPKDEYYVCRNIGNASIEPQTHVIPTYYGSHETESHEIVHQLEPGQRVLVAWVRNSFVIVDIFGRTDDRGQ